MSRGGQRERPQQGSSSSAWWAVAAGSAALTGPSLPPPRETLDFPRSWLLPVIRDHVRETRLGFFTTYFLPLATTLKNKGMGPTLVLEPWLEGVRKGS